MCFRENTLLWNILGMAKQDKNLCTYCLELSVKSSNTLKGGHILGVKSSCDSDCYVASKTSKNPPGRLETILQT